MATRFSATQARKEAELAQQRIAEEAERAEKESQRLAEERKQRAKERSQERALLKAGWEKQRDLIVLAALEGQHEVSLKPPIFLFKDLVELDITLVEIGLVKKQLTEAEAEKYAQIRYEALKQLNDRIYTLLDKFIERNKEALLPHYRSEKFMKSSLGEALSEAVESASSLFDGDEIMWSSVPRSDLARYVPALREITLAIKKYKKFLAEIDYTPYGVDEIKVDKTELAYGEYIFDESDDAVDRLRLTDRQNQFKIRWSEEVGSKFLNLPLFSGAGLSWLSSYYGQKLIAAIFETLKEAAEDGETSKSLHFHLTDDGWYYKDVVDYYSCMPDELIEIIASEGFEIVDTEASDSTYEIKVSW